MTPYRYWLERELSGRLLGPGGSLVSFVMLNPSTADDTTDDPTIRRCIGFARRLGFDRLAVANLFARRATDPAKLRGQPASDPNLGELGAWHSALGDSKLVICAWGSGGSRLWLRKMIDQRAEMLLGLRKRYPDTPLACLGKTKGGYPRHPLYVAGDKKLEVFP